MNVKDAVTKMETALTKDGRLRECNFHIDTQNDTTILLKGQVPSFHAKQIATSIAMGLLTEVDCVTEFMNLTEVC